MQTIQTHSRAKKGGELGANGEWYDGGKFIATTDHAKKLGSHKVKKTGRREIEQGVWEVQPTPESRALFPMLTGFEVYNRVTRLFRLNTDLRNEYATPDYIVIRKARIDAFNDGERWTK